MSRVQGSAARVHDTVARVHGSVARVHGSVTRVHTGAWSVALPQQSFVQCAELTVDSVLTLHKQIYIYIYSINKASTTLHQIHFSMSYI